MNKVATIVKLYKCDTTIELLKDYDVLLEGKFTVGVIDENGDAKVIDKSQCIITETQRRD